MTKCKPLPNSMSTMPRYTSDTNTYGQTFASLILCIKICDFDMYSRLRLSSAARHPLQQAVNHAAPMSVLLVDFSTTSVDDEHMLYTVSKHVASPCVVRACLHASSGPVLCTLKDVSVVGTSMLLCSMISYHLQRLSSRQRHWLLRNDVWIRHCFKWCNEGSS